MRTQILVALLHCILIVNAQDLHKLANSAYSKGNYAAAIENYEKLLKQDTNNSKYHHNLGVSYLLTNSHKTKAIIHLEKAAKNEGYNTEVIYHLARAYHLNNEFDRAIETYLRYQRESGGTGEKVDRHIGNCYSAKKLIINPIPVTFVNLGPNVNSEFPDYSPFVSKDEALLVFTSRRMGTREFDGLFPSNIYMSKKRKRINDEAISVGASVNSDYDEQSVGLSSDGKTLFVYFDHVKQFGDVYTCSMNSNNFINPEKIDSRINSDALETAVSSAPDGETIFFASNRPGGFGGLDIYMTRKLPDGSWGLAQNLGRRINTKHDEDFPTLSPDGNRLYFSSRGHANMGGFDLFFSSWNNEHTVFTRPVNLGYPINTAEDNRSISFSEYGRFAYISAIRDEGFGNLDIYKIIIDTVSPNVALVRFTLPNTVKGHISATDTLYISNNEQDQKPLRYLPNHNGVYSVILKRGNYRIWGEIGGSEQYNTSLRIDEYDLFPAIREETLDLTRKK